MNLFRRSLIFSTFIGTCLSIVLLAAALGTKYWVTANAKRVSNPNESDGRLHFGLFQGDKSLNVGYGWRHYQFSVVDILKTEPELLPYPVWASLICLVVLSLLVATLTAIVSLINTATTPIASFSGIPGLYVYNLICVVLESVTIGLWYYQFVHSLQKNVMPLEDRRNHWTSQDRASLGHSFWFVVVSACIHLINVVLLYYATSDRQKKSMAAVEEKPNGVIMLY